MFASSVVTVWQNKGPYVQDLALLINCFTITLMLHGYTGAGPGFDQGGPRS